MDSGHIDLNECLLVGTSTLQAHEKGRARMEFKATASERGEKLADKGRDGRSQANLHGVAKAASIECGVVHQQAALA